MRVIGITGGVGAGKSQVMESLRKEFGARILRTDDLAGELMRSGEAGFLQVVSHLGTGILGEDGEIDRPGLAARLFHSEEDRALVNQLIHPLVWEKVQALLCQAEAEGARLAAVESALFDDQSKAMIPEFWYIFAQPEIRIQRLMESRGYTKERCESMIKSQADDRGFRELCQVVIDNSGSFSDTENQIRQQLISFCY